MNTNPAEFNKVKKAVEEAEKLGPKRDKFNPLEAAFGVLERDAVDQAIMRFFCANGTAFNAMRSPQFADKINVVRRAPAGYKPPSYERARTTLLYECKRSFEKELGVSIISDAIDEVGPSNVVQVVTDNAANCVLAGKEIEKVHKHIFWSPCIVHTINLLFKDFGKTFPWLSDTYKKGKTIVKYVTNHQNALAMFRSYSHLELLKVAETRFASHYILLKRISDCREALVTLGDENSRKAAADVADYIKDDSFWEEVENVLRILEPLYHILKFADSEGPLMGEIYEKMNNMLGEVKDIMATNRRSSDFVTMEHLITERWEKMNVPIHCSGFALNPRFYDANYLLSTAPGCLKRNAPNLDKEVVTGVMKAFEKFATNPMEEGLFGLKAAQEDALIMDGITWWSSYGSEAPELCQIEIKILSQPISSSSAERNWSTYKFIHSVIRNRLNNIRAEKLVFIHSNLRLRSYPALQVII
ncbi:hypothetical protein RND81_14G128800 [Saponaria officinalis]|uniref:DUF659 domain-containing protein n=1 Tax=Saponaria officinalis TaxID=3572 RepID=A0AAW1GLG3_SAPOF